MLKVKLFFCVGIIAVVCCAGQQASACLTQGFDEYVVSGCGNSSCSVQICGSGGGGNVAPNQNQLLTPGYNRSVRVLLAKVFSPTVYFNSRSNDRLLLPFALMDVGNNQKKTVAMTRGGQ